MLGSVVEAIAKNVRSPDWLISVVLAGLVIGLMANYATRLIDKGFLRSVAAFHRLQETAKQRAAEIETAKARAAEEVAANPLGLWLALLIALRSEVRTILYAIAPIFLALVVFHTARDQKVASLPIMVYV